jgi:hypothetical protein
MNISGIAPDLQPNTCPAGVWNDCANVVFKDGQARRVSGDLPQLPPAIVNAEVLLFVISNAVPYWVYATATRIGVTDGATDFNITPTGWNCAAGSTYTATVINGLAVINNSSQHPVWWNGATATICAPLPGWPVAARAQAMRAHKNFLFAVGILATGGNEVWWSDAAGPGVVPQLWVPAADNLAGSVNIAPLQDKCLDAMSLRDDLLIYKSQSIWMASLVGGQFVFAFRTLFEEHGLFATNALCRGPDDQHLFVSPVGDVFLTDGVSARSVLEGRAQRTFAASFSAQSTVYAVSLQRSKQGLVVVDQQGWVYDFVSGDLGKRQVADSNCAASGRLIDAGAAASNQWDNDPNAWDTDVTQWDEQALALSNDDVLVGGVGGVFAITSPGATTFFGGVQIEASLSKDGIVLKPFKRSMFDRLRPDVDGSAGTVLKFRLSAQESANGPVTLAPAVDYAVTESDTVDVFIQGRFMGLQIASSGGEPWVLGNLEFYSREVGGW